MEHRGYAVYKEDGTPWTIKEATIVMNYCEDTDENVGNIDKELLAKKYIYDDHGKRAFMYMWNQQEGVGWDERLTEISMEELLGLKKEPMKVYKVGNYET